MAEALVALTLFAVGVLAALRADATALHLMRRALVDQAILQHAEAVIDSLRSTYALTDGGATTDGLRADWRVDAISGMPAVELSVGPVGLAEETRTFWLILP